MIDTNRMTHSHLGTALRAFAILSVAALLAAVTPAQQMGSIRGVVTDRDFEAPLPGAKVLIIETGQTVETADQGNYVFAQVTAGRYTLVFTKEGYVRQLSTDVVVAPGQLTQVDASLTGDFTDLDEFVVQDILQLSAGSEAALLQLRFESPSLIDSIGSELMSQAGASDAAAALRLVAGATVQNGKFAVVRGLPDRYVSSQINGVRLPSADEKTRAVELDQFPSAVIESIQVSKTFTPDQQADASGGAVDVRLKGIPERDAFLEFSFQNSFNSNVRGRDDFVSYEGGGVGFSGKSHGQRGIQIDNIGGNWTGAVGVEERAAPTDSKWSIATGGSLEIDENVRIGGVASFFYERDSSYYSDGVDDSYWVEDAGGSLVPRTIQGTPQDGDFKTQLFDVRRGTETVQWGGLVAGGVEFFDQLLQVVYLSTHTTEDTAILAQDTRGKEYFFPGYDPTDRNGAGNGPDDRSSAPYLRTETLEYTEREIETLMFSGDHKLALGGVDLGFLEFGDPEFDWTFAQSRADLTQPDKRQFGALWLPPSTNPGAPPFIPAFDIDNEWFPFKPAANFTLGNFQRIYKDIEEESDQYFFNLKFPFETEGGLEGSVRVGMFVDDVDRRFNQETFSNFNDAGASYVAGFDAPWSRVFGTEDHAITESDFDVDYNGDQQIESFYAMLDVPITAQLSVVGGVRFESTETGVEVLPEDNATWFPPGATTPVALNAGDPDANADFSQDDVLPALALLYTPFEDVTVRLSYSETVARQTFRELTPVLQQEFLGGPIFIGNPDLRMASLKNYDVRIDYTPFEGSLFSASFFHKDIEDPIEFVQRLAGFDFTTAVNYPDGELRGFEFEARQRLGELWTPLSGLTVGGNATLIDSEVTLPASEQAVFASPAIQQPRSTRDATAAPESLFNLSLTYDIEATRTRVGVFYTVTGDTLAAGAGENNGNYVPDVYSTRFDNLNVTVSQKLGSWASLKLQAKNLTDPDIETEYRTPDGQRQTKTSFTRGVDYSLSIGGEINF